MVMIRSTLAILALMLALALPADALERGEVRAMQRALAAEGFDPGPVDGLLGPRTRRALAAWQTAEGLAPDGEPDPETLARLLGAPAATPPRTPAPPLVAPATRRTGDRIGDGPTAPSRTVQDATAERRHHDVAADGPKTPFGLGPPKDAVRAEASDLADTDLADTDRAATAIHADTAAPAGAPDRTTSWPTPRHLAVALIMLALFSYLCERIARGRPRGAETAASGRREAGMASTRRATRPLRRSGRRVAR